MFTILHCVQANATAYGQFTTAKAAYAFARKAAYAQGADAQNSTFIAKLGSVVVADAFSLHVVELAGQSAQSVNFSFWDWDSGQTLSASVQVQQTLNTSVLLSAQADATTLWHGHAVQMLQSA